MPKYKVRVRYLVETEREIEADSLDDAEDYVYLPHMWTPLEEGVVVFEDTLDIVDIERI